MSEYSPPCLDGLCEVLGKGPSESTKRLCESIGNCIIGAGGSGLLEVTVCPMIALQLIGPEQSDPRMVEIRDRLGVIGYWENAGLLDR